jgi:NAD(P)-dependent dehydrogenase (short-subunit alcohol dehydrogenase family)
MNLKGMAAIVTGGASGLGGATAEALAREGARVAVVDVNADAAAAMAQRIGGISLVCDVADSDAAERAVARAREAHGPARVLVNCAGVGTPGRIVGREGPLPLANYERVIRINLIGTFNMLRLAAVDMTTADPLEDGERGVIINTASVAAYDGQIGQAAYASSKAGVVGLTLPAAREFARFGVRVVTIAPGLFETPMLRSLPPEAQKSLADSVPFPQRLGQPAEYAALALHIIANRMLNGETIRLDGAIRMAPR